MLQALPCPSCHRTLVLTAEVSLKAVLCCRHCTHQFVLGEMVEAEMGFWEVIDDPNAPEAKVVSAGESVSEAEEIQPEKSEEYISPQMLIKAQAEKKKTDQSKFVANTYEQYERMHKKKGKSPVWSMLSVLLGGLASIPIATLLIWHVLGKDPLQMGPVVARYAPWIVPMRFRPHRFDDENDPPAPLAEASGLPRVGNGESPTAQMEPFRRRDRSAPSAFPTPSADPADGISSEESTAVVRQELETPSKDVFSIISQVEKDLEAWNERGEDRELNKKLALQTYSDLASLALAVNLLPSANPIRKLVRTELQSVGQEVAQHVDIQKLIQLFSASWIASHQEELVGLALVVNIGGVIEVENVWQITPTTAVGKESIQIIAPKQIIPALSEGQSIFVIGCLTRAKSAENADSSETVSSSTLTLAASYIYAIKP